MEQVADVASDVPQALEPVAMAKSPGLVPPMAMLLMVSVPLPVFDSVAAKAAEVVATLVLGKVRLGASVAAGVDEPAVPLPFRRIVFVVDPPLPEVV